MSHFHTDEDIAMRTLLRNAPVEPHPGEDGFSYAARLLREHDRARRSRRVLAVARVGIAVTLTALGLTVF